MKAQLPLGLPDELVVDNFAGGGGASVGIERGIGRPVDIAINHDETAVALHRENHPHTTHYECSVFRVDPRKITGNQPVGLAWFSPDCRHFSRAKGKKPVSQKIRGLAWVVIRWAHRVRPRVIMLENVPEFLEWGPLDGNGVPITERAGETFQQWVAELRRRGYRVEWRKLRACDYGAPTIRERLFLVARRDGLPIRWPEPTHGDAPGLEPYRTAAECIDWSIPCPSIFERSKPLAEATQRRIAKGIERFVVNDPEPFTVRTDMHKSNSGCAYPLSEPLRTITSSGGHALAVPFIVGAGGRMGQSRPRGMDEPMQTVTAKADSCLAVPFVSTYYGTRGDGNGDGRGQHLAEPLRTQTTENRHALAVPYLVPRYGERPGQEPRVQPLNTPLATIVPSGNGARMAAAYMAQHNTGMTGRKLVQPLSTIVAKGCTQNLVTAELGTGRRDHADQVRAFLTKYYTSDGNPSQNQSLREPLHTVPTQDRYGLVTVHGRTYRIVDIGMRMLQPRELFRAQGFPDWYEIDQAGGRKLPKHEKTRLVGNSVPPDLPAALVEANFVHERASDSGVA
jgi:DNA (cytosine-5)-methyltransferase 1